jgi:hypothetical protein
MSELVGDADVDGTKSTPRFIHAYERNTVVVSALVPQWRNRIAGVFAFPKPTEFPEILMATIVLWAAGAALGQRARTYRKRDRFGCRRAGVSGWRAPRDEPLDGGADRRRVAPMLHDLLPAAFLLLGGAGT